MNALTAADLGAGWRLTGSLGENPRMGHMEPPVRVQATQLYLAMLSEPEQHVLGLVVPGAQDTGLAESYRHSVFDGTAFQDHDSTSVARWGVESQTKVVHLLATFEVPPLALDIVVPATGRFERPLRSAYKRPAGTNLLVVMYDSEADAEQANSALKAGDGAVWRSLGIAVGENLDMGPLALLFGR